MPIPPVRSPTNASPPPEWVGSGAGDYLCEDGDDFEDGVDSGGMGFKRGKGDVRGCRRERPHEDDEVIGGSDGRGRCGSDVGDRVVGAFLATGFADGFERLEDQEAGYAAFAAFLVRVLDQMP